MKIEEEIKKEIANLEAMLPRLHDSVNKQKTIAVIHSLKWVLEFR